MSGVCVCVLLDLLIKITVMFVAYANDKNYSKFSSIFLYSVCPCVANMFDYYDTVL